jgi:hypothetical protein
MPKLELEWQVDLKHTGYHLNGRGPSPQAAMEDLIKRANSQLSTATEERDRLIAKIENLDSYLEQLSI